MTLARPARRGYSLIEMLTVIACLGVVLTLTGGLMHQMLRLDRGERDRGVVAASLERLGRALRADAHAATGPVGSPGDRLVIPLADGRSVEYLVRQADVVRTIRQGGKVKGTEIYARPKGTSARFEVSKNGAASMVSLDLTAPPGEAADPLYRGYRIEAEAGRDAREGAR